MSDASGQNPNPRPGHVRLWAALILLGSAAVLAVAFYLHPNPRGVGTHAQLGAGPCGFLVMTGYPCPTCGMTTAFAFTVRGQWLQAFWAQPAGFLLALGVLGAAITSLFSLATGRWPRWHLPFFSPLRLFAALLVLFVGSWAFKIVVGLLDKTLPYH